MTKSGQKSAYAGRRGGFTLTQTLVVVAVLTILSVVAVTSLRTMRTNLRQKELDSKAAILYTAAQNRLTELRAAGYAGTYQYSADGANGVQELGYTPCDAEAEAQTGGALCYVDSADKQTAGMAAASILPESAVDAELWGGTWRVEYDPESGCVYSVFYSESAQLPADALEVDRLRVRANRRSGGAVFGYYGGDRVRTEVTHTLTPDITIDNSEELTAYFYCNNPGSGKLTFRITLSTGAKTYTRTVGADELEAINSQTYRYKWVLDSLRSDAARFAAQTENQLDSGAELTVKLTVTCSDPLIDQASFSRRTNGLFYYTPGAASDTALIRSARHLQNLDSASGVTDTITRAVQVSDVSFREDAASSEDWYTVYHDMPFKAIENANLLSYDGYYSVDGAELYSSIHGLHITGDADQPQGLFAAFTGEAIRNVTLTGTRIDTGSDVGALVGSISSAVTVENCRVYLSARRGDLAGLTAADTPAGVTPWLNGKNVGGLIGAVTQHGSAAIRSSMAATVIRGTQSGGGLVGLAPGRTDLDTVYADCYITAPTTGGLIGNGGTGANITLKNFYAAGYQAATQMAAGVTPSAVASAESGYSVCDYTLNHNTQCFSTAAACLGLVENVYYLINDDVAFSAMEQTRQVSYTELSSRDFAAAHLNDAFTGQTGGASYPYNLMAQGLSDYSYPRLAALNHYGDWQAEFESGALVYYEVYRENGQDVYAFSGANAYTLRSDRVAVGDGYALAFAADPGAAFTIGLEYAGGQTMTLTAATRIPVTAQQQTYYLVPLPTAVVDTDYVDGSGSNAFYQQIVVDGKSYYYNPHFAESVTAGEQKPDAPEHINIRTARQLYALSRFYPDYAASTTASAYMQRLDVDYTSYRWGAFTTHGAISEQQPITSEAGFTAAYDGGGHTVHGVSFRTSASRIGLFGTIAARGVVQDVTLLGDGGSLTYAGQAGDNTASGSSQTVQMGALAGYNHGTIRNCAAAGYGVTFHVYNSSTLTLGGLAGANSGAITNSMADTARMDLTTTNGSVYAGGLVGSNSASITGSYALGRISLLDSKRGTAQLGGFAASNAGGVIRRCYSATALTAAGAVESYGFAPKGGAAVSCYYLDGGTYAYDGVLYAYNTSHNEFANLAAGQPLHGEQLRALLLREFSGADATFEADGSAADEDYPFPAVVTNAAGDTVHYGPWPVQADIGTLGVFYWEYEEGGNNSGYHFSYIGTSQGTEISSNENDLLSGNSLCREHDDGGVITRYGYGYFYETDAAARPTLRVTRCVTGSRVAAAEEALARQMSGYTFIAYQTGNMYLTSEDQNSTWTLDYAGLATYSYEVCPFFANAMSLKRITLDGVEQELDTAVRTQPTGTEDNPYEIRSVAQLQYINWNWAVQSATYSLSKDNTSSAYDRWTIQQYPYLIYTDEDTAAPLSRGLSWKQSHNLDSYLEQGRRVVNFTPIGSLYDVASALDSAESYPYTAFFAEHYDGQSYAIKNIEIHSDMQCIGLFGITAGAKLENIVLYSDRGSEIENGPDGTNWYTVGGLVGFAASRDPDAKASITNCTVSGYKIVDHRGKGYSVQEANSEHQTGWGGGCVGGLVGATNMNIVGCTAVNEITLDFGYNYKWLNLRVGGIAGACRATIDSCYAGGSIKSIVPFANQYYDKCTSIWIGGITGGIVLRTEGSIAQILGSVTNPLLVTNCYSFVEVPQRGSNLVASAQSIASNGEMQQYFATIAGSAAELRNCYALRTTAANADDFREYGGSETWPGSQNLNVLSRWEDKRRITLYNDSTPYLSYSEMSSILLDKLQNGGGTFGMVTTTESGVAINGKYSHPGNDEALDGQNYPFPTVLTQEDTIFHRTVNVHYGAWPKFGLYWERNTASLDLLNVQEGTGRAAVQVRLYVEGASVGGAKPQITVRADDDAAAGAAPAAQVGEISDYDADGGYYTVTFYGTGVGEALAEAEMGGFTAALHLTVTAELTLEADPVAPELYVGDTEALTLTVRHANGDLLPQAAAEQLQWTVLVDSGDSEQDVVECSAEDVVYDAASGTFRLPMTGFAAGEAVVRIACLYPYTAADGQTMTVTQTVYLSATVSPNDVLGLTNGTEYQDIRVPHTVPEGTTGYLGRPAESGPAADGLMLYATSAYVDLEAFTLESAVILDGAPYPVGSDGFTPGKEYRLTLADDVLAQEGYQTRSITLETARTGPVTVELVLMHDGVRYTLAVRVTPEETQYDVTFTAPDGAELFTRRALYGGTVTLTDDEQAYGYQWHIPDAIYEPLTLEPLRAAELDDAEENGGDEDALPTGGDTPGDAEEGSGPQPEERSGEEP